MGLNSYTPETGLHDLKFAAADARAVADRLDRAGYAVSTVLDTATRSDFLSALDDATAELQRNDLFLLYFAGHAQLDPSAGGKQLALLFSDDEGSEGDGLQVDELAERIDSLAAKRRVVMLDTCYSERTQRMLSMQRGESPVDVPRVGQFDAWIFSAAPRQSAQEDPELGHGVFTWFLLEALDGAADADGDGTVGVLEVYNWVGFKTAERTGRAQVPWIEESRIGWDDLGLVTVEARGEVAAIPWYERVIPGAQILLDGIARGPGSVDAGVHRLEVRDRDGELVLRRKVNARGGDVLEWDGWLAASRGRVRVGAGLGWAGSAEVAPFSGTLGGWYTPRSALGIRPAFGAQGALGRARLDDVSVDTGSASARTGLVWSATPGLGLGPYIGGGATWIFTPSGVGTSPMAEAGLVFLGDLGALWVGAEGGVRVFSEGALPTASLMVGAALP